MNKVIAALAVLASVICSGQAMAAEYKKMTIRAATANTETSLHAYGIEKFKEIVEKESGGAITVQTFYGGSLGDEQANVKQLRNGELQLAVLATGNLTPFAPSAGIFYLPYIFPSMEDAIQLLSDEAYITKLGDAIAKESATRPLSWLIGGYAIITNSKKPIEKLEDIQGLKIRVPAVELQLAYFKSWGVEAHPLAWTETFNGLQQGVVDGQENPSSVVRDQKFWEVQKYGAQLNYRQFTAPMLFSDRWLRKLDPASKALVVKAAQEAAKAEWEWMIAQDAIFTKELVDNGMVITKVTDEPKWMEASKAIWADFYDKIGGKPLVDAAVKIMESK